MDNKGCVICRKREEEEQLSTVTKASQSLIESSVVLNLEQLYNNLKNAEVSNETAVHIHSRCIKKYKILPERKKEWLK